jgi:heat shock protein HslJ
MTSTSRRVAAFAASLLCSACTTMSTGDSAVGLDGTAWVLAALPAQALVPGTNVTARFEGGRIQGTDGCNRYTVPYTATGRTLQVGSRGAATLMACPPAVSKQAEAFMSALTRASSHRIEGGRLQLLAADGAVLATFDAQSQTLAGTSWRVTAYNNGRQAVVSTLAGTNLTMGFASDGRVAGSAGCNNFTATYSLDGEKLAIGPAAATRRMCASPDRVMEQEAEFLKALGTVATARLEGDRLDLRTAGGQLAATLAKEAAR